MPRSPSGDDEDRGRGLGPRGEIYVEYTQVGKAMRVIAVDAATGTEVVIMGPASVSQKDLERIAVRKLKARLGKPDGEIDEDEGGDETDPKGWIA